MKYIRLIKYKLLLWFTDWERNEINSEEEELWLADSYRDPGFKSYCRIRNLEILKNMAIASEKRDMHTILELNGQRKEILKLQARAKIQSNKI